MPEFAGKAVFLRYASQDAEAARRICEALRAAGVEVWFDQNELVGGDAWDAKIRGRIGSCALFIPVISMNTQARDEGYFRLEWKLAVDRSHLMAHDRAFLLPVVMDSTPDASARVPPEFRAVQWTSLPGAFPTPEFIAQVKRVLAQPQTSVISGAGRPTPSAGPLIATTAATIREKSIAVLPFVNMSAGKEQEYFSDGLAEEVINLLAHISELKVIARTSAFAFRGKEQDIRGIASALGVNHVLEGSVRRAGNRLRITAQLIQAVDGTHLWSERFDRECLQLQQQVEEGATPGPRTLQCYAGLSETVVPVRVGDTVLGYLQTGQVFLRAPSKKHFQDLTRLIHGRETGPNPRELKSAYFKTRVVTEKQYAAIIRLLAIFAEHLAAISNQLLIREAAGESPMMAKARTFIAEHQGEELHLGEVARTVNMSSFYFCKRFRMATGLTFTDYLARARTESAKHMLLNVHTRISEACYAAGFQSLSQFNRVFHRITGEAPSSYRDRLHGLNGKSNRNAVLIHAA